MTASNSLHEILLQPTDLLFFRDGRPMSGASSGHTAAWPLPDITSHALHAALHRARLDNVHGHDHRQSGRVARDVRKFGSLLTAGPFPVRFESDDGRPLQQPKWYFPRPVDTPGQSSVTPSLRPIRGDWRNNSSLPSPLLYAVGNTQPPSKDTLTEPWISAAAYKTYLEGASSSLSADEFITDNRLSDTEHAIGIAIDPETGTTGQGDADGKIYTAHYLRIRNEFRLGLFAECLDKINGDPQNKRDLIADLLNGHPQSIVVGGQQRICTARRRRAASPLPFPLGKTDHFNCCDTTHGKRWLVKWILLTPAIWPEIPNTSKDGRPLTPHHGGWLPNWVRSADGQVMLRVGRRRKRAYNGRHSRGFADDARPIPARLVAAIIPKPIAVTGWALPNNDAEVDGGAKSTHLAVPAGAVYYFEAESPEAARDLAAALNWHGETDGEIITNRRSTLLGEKGYGLGVCGTWTFFA